MELDINKKKKYIKVKIYVTYNNEKCVKYILNFQLVSSLAINVDFFINGVKEYKYKSSGFGKV